MNFTVNSAQRNKHGNPEFTPVWDWRFSTKPGKIHATIFQWPTNGIFELAGHKKLKVNQTEAGVTLSLPAVAPDKIASVVCLEIADAVVKVGEPK